MIRRRRVWCVYGDWAFWDISHDGSGSILASVFRVWMDARSIEPTNGAGLRVFPVWRRRDSQR